MFRRFLNYILIGIVFGVFDFYYQAFITHRFSSGSDAGPGSQIVFLALVLGIWLVPVIPIIIDAVKASHSIFVAVLACVLTWCAAVIAYYLTNGVQLAFIGVPGRPEMHFSNRSDPFFWSNWKNVFLGDLIGGSLEWLIVALIGGMLVGFLVSFIYLRLWKPNRWTG